MAVSVTANAASTPLGGTGSAAQAGAMGSSGGTTTGTVACSSCCAPQGRCLVSLFGGYGYTGSCPGAFDNSQPFDLYFTAVFSFDSPYTAAQFCLPSSLTITGKSSNYYSGDFYASTCSTISPPATQSTVFNGQRFYISSDASNNSYMYFFLVEMCSCSSTNRVALVAGINPPQLLTVVSCSPPVYSFSAQIGITGLPNISYGTAAVTITF